MPLCLTSWTNLKKSAKTSEFVFADLQKSGSFLGAISKRLKVPRSSVQTIVCKYKQHGGARLWFATAHGDKDRTFGRNVLWSDKRKIELFGHNDHCYVWRKKGEACKPKNTIPTVKHVGGSIMLWGCFTKAWSQMGLPNGQRPQAYFQSCGKMV